VNLFIIGLQKTAALRKLRRRIRLDKARKNILGKWAPRDPRATWTELCHAMSESDLRHFIHPELCLHGYCWMTLLPWFTTEGVPCDKMGTTLHSAHEADVDLVRDAVVHADPGDLKALKNIYGCVFDEDLQ
jgi:hypothetical protein